MGPRLPARLAALAALAALLGGCASPDLPMVTGEGWNSSSRFRKLVVLPFYDQTGQGSAIAAQVGTELSRSGYVVVEPPQTELLIKELHIEQGEELSLSLLADIRAKTYADAVVTGSVQPGWKSVTIVAIETKEGDVVASAQAKAPFRDVFRHNEELAKAAAQALATSAAK